MNKLFLSSSFRDVAKLFAEFSDVGLEGKRVTFIPTAAIPEKVNFYVKAGKKALEELGLIIERIGNIDSNAKRYIEQTAK